MRCSLSAVAAAGATVLEDVPMSPAGRGAEGAMSPGRSPAFTYLGSPSICGSGWGASSYASPSPAPSPAKSVPLARMMATPPPMPRSAAAASPGARAMAVASPLSRSGAAASPMQKGIMAVSPMVHRSPVGKSPMLALSPGGEIRRNAGILGIPLNLRSDGEVSLPVPVRNIASRAVIAPSPARRGGGAFQAPVIPMSLPAAPSAYVTPALPAGVATTAAIQGIARPFMRSGIRRGGA